MKNFLILPAVLLFLTSCDFGKAASPATGTNSTPAHIANDLNHGKEDVDRALENWHKAAATANFEGYFNIIASNGIFIGTDATENWSKEEFQNFAKPYFDRDTAWDFTPLERNIFMHDNQQLAWFDELLDTWMGICRGSGVVALENGEWKIKHYVLSVTIPNDNIQEVVKINKEFNDNLLKELRP